MIIIRYDEKYKQQVIDLILHIQNFEAKIGLSIEKQPDLLNIPLYYNKQGGGFWLAVNGNEVVGTIAFMNYGDGNAVLKKFFVKENFRSQKVGLALYQTLIDFLNERKYIQVLLDTPSVAKVSHRFYETAGFKEITKDELPFNYEYPDRNSFLFLLKL